MMVLLSDFFDALFYALDDFVEPLEQRLEFGREGKMLILLRMLYELLEAWLMLYSGSIRRSRGGESYCEDGEKGQSQNTMNTKTMRTHLMCSFHMWPLKYNV